jgi:hypothetical protein
MAKTKGFLLSDKTMYKLYKEGIDFYYYKGMPIVRYYAPLTKSQKRSRSISPYKYLLQTYFKDFVFAYKSLSPLTKALLRAEARYYSMSAKDLFMYYFMLYISRKKQLPPVWGDIYLYNYQNNIIVDYINADLESFYLLKLLNHKQATFKTRKFRGTFEMCKRPVCVIQDPYYLVPFPLSTPTYNVYFTYTAKLGSSPSTKTYYYSRSPEEVFPSVAREFNSQWRTFTSRYFDYAFFAQWTVAHSTSPKYVTASGWNYFTDGYYAIESVPGYQDVKKISLDFSTCLKYNDATPRYIKEVNPFVMFLDRFLYALDFNLQYLTFPRIPSGFAPVRRIYCRFFSPYTFASILNYLGLPATAGSLTQTCYMRYFPTLKAIKGRYFVFRYYIPLSDIDLAHAVVVPDWAKNKYLRISPVIIPRAVKQIIKEKAPPDISIYQTCKGIYEDIILSQYLPNYYNYAADFISNVPINYAEPQLLQPQKLLTEEFFHIYRQEYFRNPSITEEQITKILQSEF